jgi:glycosyltransferase involved in cell wall biosynthesis
MASHGNETRRRRVLIIVENLPVPFDRRVWSEATTLAGANYDVSVICPMGPGAMARYEVLDGIHIYRHPLPFEAHNAFGFFIEYGCALFWEFVLAWRVHWVRGFDVVHACNPPDLIFLVGGIFKLLFGTKFVFDQHDINPELFEAKFGRRGFWYGVLLALERLTFRIADISIATNDSYRAIAIERGRIDANRVFVVRSGPNLERLRIMPPNPLLKKGRRYLVGYVGVMGRQEGIHYLLEAARRIVHDFGFRDVQFGLVGAGSELEGLKKLANSLEIAEYITFTGRVSDHELLEMLNTADICVNPDEFNIMNDKSTMNKVMEYMALAKPIVQFDLTEGRFSAGDASLYARRNDAVDLADKILDLLKDEGKRRMMGEFARRRVIDHLAWPYEAPKLLKAYETLFGAGL